MLFKNGSFRMSPLGTDGFQRQPRNEQETHLAISRCSFALSLIVGGGEGVLPEKE